MGCIIGKSSTKIITTDTGSKTKIRVNPKVDTVHYYSKLNDDQLRSFRTKHKLRLLSGLDEHLSELDFDPENYINIVCEYYNNRKAMGVDTDKELSGMTKNDYRAGLIYPPSEDHIRIRKPIMVSFKDDCLAGIVVSAKPLANPGFYAKAVDNNNRHVFIKGGWYH